MAGLPTQNTHKTSLVGGAITILKNIPVRQWEGLYLPYVTWKIPKPCLKPPTSTPLSYYPDPFLGP
jgi:hypothetical protein